MVAVVPMNAGLTVSSAHHARVSPDAHKQWISPLGKAFVIHRSFQRPPHPYAAGHRGIDIPATTGAQVRSPTNATVYFVGRVVDRVLVTLQTDDGLLITLEPVVTELEVGSAVTPGDNFGVVAEGGHCHNACLHLGVRLDGDYVNPLPYFVKKPRLLPWTVR